jgi:hypothetical protein
MLLFHLVFIFEGSKETKYCSMEVICYDQKNSKPYHLIGTHCGVRVERVPKN